MSKKRGDINVSELAYNAWGDENVQKEVEKKIENAIYNGASANAVDSRTFTALHWAAEYDWPSLITTLVEAHRFPPNLPTDLNLRGGPDGKTALMIAVERGHPDCVEDLLEKGADTRLECDGMTAVDMAIEEEDEEIYEIMCKFDPSLAEFDDDGLDMHEDMMAEINELEKEFGPI